MKNYNFFKRHKIVTMSLILLAVFVSVLIIYSIMVIARASSDTPRVVAKATAPEKIKLRLEDFPEEYKQILLTVEDPNFYTHNGVDFGTPGAGWTTITQGIVKIYFYDGFTPGTFRYRKFEQSLIAWTFTAS